jgi:hypothetical protein
MMRNRFNTADVIRAGAMIALLASIGATVWASQSAQSPAPTSLEGTWRVEVIASDCAGNERPPFWAYLTFTRGGTVTGTTSNQQFPGTRTADQGTWSSLGPSTYSAVTEAFVLFGPPPAPPAWAHRLSQTITMLGRNEFISEATSEFFVASGPLPWTAAARSGCARATGYRFE